MLRELRLLEEIKRVVKRRQKEVLVSIGDDGCVLKHGTVLTTDAFVEGVHFDLGYMTFSDVGRRVMGATLSDIAAMGASPICVLVSLLLPPSLRRRDVLSLYKGMERVVERFGVEITGGEVSSSSLFSLVLTAMGKTSHPCKRSGALPGDKLYISGELGLSETGRIVLRKGLRKRGFKRAIEKHLHPLPRIKEAISLRNLLSSLIDTSDGLSTDTFHIASESKVRIRIFLDRLPVSREAERVCKMLDLPLKDFVLNAGEDYELLFTSSERLPKELSGTIITCIGEVEEGEGTWIVEREGEKRLLPKGYEHFRPH